MSEIDPCGTKRVKQLLRLVTYLVVLLVYSSQLFAQDVDVQPLDPFHLYEIRIQIPDKNWENRLKKYRELDRSDKIIASVSVDGKTVDSVGIRFKGNSSFNSVRKKGDRKLPFSLSANDFVKGQEFPTGHRNLKLSNGFRDPSYLRDVLSFYIARAYMPAPQCAMAKVFVNEEYFGVYTLTQDIDKQFLEHWFQEKQGPFFKCDPEWQQKPLKDCPLSDQCSLEFIGKKPACYAQWYEMKSEHGWEDLIHMISQLNEDNPEIGQFLDVDRALWMLAFNALLVNLDSYSGRLCHNYFLYKHRDSLFVPLIWDLNLSFGGFRMADKVNLSDEEMVSLSPVLHDQHPRRPLIQKLLENPHYKKVYIAHMETMMDEFFRNEHYKTLMADWLKLLDKSVKEEKMALYPYELFKENQHKSVLIGNVPVVGITSLMDERISYLNKHPLFQHAAPVVHNVSIATDSIVIDLQDTDSLATDSLAIDSLATYSIQQIVHCQVDDATVVWLYWKKENSLRYYQTMMEPTPRAEGDSTMVFTVGLPKDSIAMAYYVVAENEHRAIVYPRRATSAPLLYVPEEER